MDLELLGDKNLLVRNDGKTYTVLAVFTDSSDLTNFNKDEEIKGGRGSEIKFVRR